MNRRADSINGTREEFFQPIRGQNFRRGICWTLWRIGFSRDAFRVDEIILASRWDFEVILETRRKFEERGGLRSEWKRRVEKERKASLTNERHSGTRQLSPSFKLD